MSLNPFTFGTLYDAPAKVEVLGAADLEEQFPGVPVVPNTTIYAHWQGQDFILADRAYRLTVDHETLIGHLVPAFTFGSTALLTNEALAACTVGGVLYIVVAEDAGAAIWAYSGGAAAIREASIGAIRAFYTLFHDGTSPYLVRADPGGAGGASSGLQRNNGLWNVALSGLPDEGAGPFYPAPGSVTFGGTGYIVGTVPYSGGGEIHKPVIVGVAAGVVTAYTDATYDPVATGGSLGILIAGLVKYGGKLYFMCQITAGFAVRLFQTTFAAPSTWTSIVAVTSFAPDVNINLIENRVYAVSWRRKIWLLLQQASGTKLYACNTGDPAVWSTAIASVANNKDLFLLQ